MSRRLNRTRGRRGRTRPAGIDAPPKAQEHAGDPAAAHLARGGAVILFDGVCNLCNASVLFVIDRDPHARFLFAPLQSAEAVRLLRARRYAGRELGSVLLVHGDQVHARSTAALKVARHLRGGWPLLAALLFVPRPIRDAVYDWVARNRYRWFGRRDACRVPTPALRSRFIG